MIGFYNDLKERKNEPYIFSYPKVVSYDFPFPLMCDPKVLNELKYDQRLCRVKTFFGAISALFA